MTVCLNCDRVGHRFRSCNKPVRSYGIIAYKQDKNNMKNIKYLLIRRRNTIGFTDFLRGKYKTFNVIDMSKVKTLIEEMTNIEKQQILNENFDTLWDTLWMNHNSGIYLNEKEKARTMFNKIDIKSLLRESTSSKYEEQEYGFPKGRKNLYESPVECAIREFKEETGLHDDDFRLSIFFNPVSENFIGSDKIKYSHFYYLAEIIRDIDISVLNNNAQYLEEVDHIGMYDYSTSYKLFRDYHVQKKFTLMKVNEWLSKPTALKLQKKYTD